MTLVSAWLRIPFWQRVLAGFVLGALAGWLLGADAERWFQPLASVLGSFGTAGVPGTAVIMATVVLSAAGLPLETIGYLYAIDRVLDMMRTMTNVTGQMLVPVLVAKETGLLDRTVYEAASSNVGIEDEEAPVRESA